MAALTYASLALVIPVVVYVWLFNFIDGLPLRALLAAEIFREFCAATDDSQEPRANFATIYISEAHAEDDWALPPPMARELGEGAHISLARTMADRIDAAKRFQARFQYRPSLYCDSLSDDAMDTFQAWPERAFIFERGVCVFAGGKGPFDFDLAKVQAWLRQRFATSS